MESKMKLLFFCLLFTQLVSAYIPPTRVIFQKMTENSGSGGYEIIKEVHFNHPEAFPLKETWKIENERMFKVTIEPLNSTNKEKMHILYVNGQRAVITNQKREVSKLSIEHAERLFHFRNVENLAAYFANLQVLSSASGNLDLARLNRAQGVITYGLGKKTPEGSSSLLPYLWIEQDRFVIRKVRFENGTEVRTEAFQTYPRGLYHPQEINLKWGDKSARIKTVSVTLKKWPKDTFQINKLEDSQKFLSEQLVDSTSQEFYKRFR
jgi:hypothetical protein